MSHALKTSMTKAEFLEWEPRQEGKWEFDGYGPVAMAGGTSEHAALQANLAITIGTRLRGTPCRFFGSDLKIEVAGRIRYPDGFVVCTPVARGTTVATDPTVIFEVLSDSTERKDRIEKNREYRATPSVQRYVMLEQDAIAATVWERQGDDWIGHLLWDGATLAMPEIGIELPLAELYAGVELPPARAADPGV